MNQHAGRSAFVQPLTLEPAGSLAERHDLRGGLRRQPGLVRDDLGLDAGGRERELDRCEALARRGLQVS